MPNESIKVDVFALKATAFRETGGKAALCAPKMQNRAHAAAFCRARMAWAARKASAATLLLWSCVRRST